MLEPDHLLALLTEQNIPFHLYHHQAVDNAAAAAEVRARMKGLICKSLFLRGKDASLWLFTVPLDSRVDLKALDAVLGCGRMSFGDADSMYRHLGVRPGSVTPLALLNDTEGAVRLLMDASLTDVSMVNVHPLINTMSVDMAPTDLITLLTAHGHAPRLLDGLCRTA